MNLPFIECDKANHIIYGASVYILATIVTQSPAVGLVACTAVGVGKEIYDSRDTNHHTPDVWDAVATVAGGLAIFLYGLCI